jgi:hypothetical protein
VFFSEDVQARPQKQKKAWYGDCVASNGMRLGAHKFCICRTFLFFPVLGDDGLMAE